MTILPWPAAQMPEEPKESVKRLFALTWSTLASAEHFVPFSSDTNEVYDIAEMVMERIVDEALGRESRLLRRPWMATFNFKDPRDYPLKCGHGVSLAPGGMDRLQLGDHFRIGLGITNVSRLRDGLR